MTYRIELGKFSEWKDKISNGASQIKIESNTVKDILYLALLDQKDKLLSYEDIASLLKTRGVISGEINVLNLRNAMSQLTEEVKSGERFEIESIKQGKKALFRIVDKKPGEKTLDAEPSGDADDNQKENNKIICIFDNDSDAPMQKVARRFLRNRIMPFYGIYLPLRAAAKWVSYSEKNESASDEKRKYEGEQCEKLLKEWFVKCKKRSDVLSIIGLGVGEGIGEIELIERLLNRGFTIHYCAIDMNTYLLMDHATRLEYKFREQIKEKKLICSLVTGNFLTDFGKIVETARKTLKNKEIHDDFIPEDSSILVSILGNVIGNPEEQKKEWTYFQIAIDKFEKQDDLAFLFGIGVQQENEEDYELDDLFLTTPRYLTHELGIIESHYKAKTKDDREFYISENKAEEKPVIKDYEGDGFGEDNIKGKIYEFLYTTKGKLSMHLDTQEVIEVLPETKLLLYNIIKFELNSLFNLLKTKGITFPSENIKTHNLGTDEVKTIYAVIAGIFERKRIAK